MRSAIRWFKCKLKPPKKQQEESQKLENQLAELKIESKIELEKQKQQQWAAAIGKIREVQKSAQEAHDHQMDNIHSLITGLISNKDSPTDMAAAISALITKVNHPEEEERLRREKEEQEKNRQLVNQLLEQQKQLQDQAAALAEASLDTETRALLSAITKTHTEAAGKDNSQQLLLDQLRTALTTKSTEDPQKNYLKTIPHLHQHYPYDRGGYNTETSVAETTNRRRRRLQHGRMACHVQQARPR